ncbi:MAG: helix-turn-helix domain-containing protein, partial [Planctomycetaceae bacterium]|nr:helix-turn-helix domain-containing protein [Planctomycetaceae bacterium]
MKRLMTQGEVRELLRCSFSTLSRMMNSGDFVNPVNGRGRKLLFDPDAVEKWIKARQQPQQAI